MALNTEIDALLAEADTQGVTVEQILQQVYLRSQEAASTDDFPDLAFQAYFPDPGGGPPIPTWQLMKAYFSDLTNTMPTDVAYARAWSAFYVREEILFLECVFQLVRCFARDFQTNPAYPSYAVKSDITYGTTALSL